jgi:paraquat-inducible protein B
MMEQALSARLKEMAPAAPAQQTTPAFSKIDPKLKAAQDKVKKNQTLTPEEQKLINDVAAQLQENRLRRAYQTLKESEVQQAQVVLAAQDMVDKMQSMLEDTTEMQFKELPALVDSIRNQIGIEQATQFNADVTAALQGLVQNLQSAKQQLDTALGVITGQAAPADAGIASIPGAAPDAGMAPDADLAAAGQDLEAAADADLATAAEPEAALGTQGALGRGRR